MDGWMNGKAGLWIAYSNQIIEKRNMYREKERDRSRERDREKERVREREREIHRRKRERKKVHVRRAARTYVSQQDFLLFW